MARLRNAIFASTTVAVSTAVTFLTLNILTNLFSMRVFAPDFFPRGWLIFFGDFYRTLYVQAHDRELNEWTAILGDSHAEGGGDAYLSGEPKFNLAHHLRDERTENFLVFGRSGAGSVRAVREFLITSQEMSDALFLPNVEWPDEIIFLFYEGNDLTDNLRHLELRGYDNTQLSQFVSREMSIEPDWRRSVDFYLPLLRPTYGLTRSAAKAILSFFRKDDSSPPAHDLANFSATNSFTLNGQSSTTEVAIPLQSAAVELSKEELNLGIQVFQESILFISDKFPDINITVVYLPSPATVYDWNEPLIVQTYFYPENAVTTKALNQANSEYIRSRLRTFLSNEDIDFIDATPEFQATARFQALHGPRDWKHTNQDGYALLARIILKQRAP